MISLVSTLESGDVKKHVMTPQDKDKTELLYIKYERMMYAIAFKILKHKEDSEDAVHNAFENIMLNIDKVGDPDSKRTRAFLSVIVRHEAINELKRRNPNVISFEELNEEDLASESLEDQIFSTNPDFACEELTELNKTYRDALVLRYYNDLSLQEIADVLGISLSAAKKRMQRGEAAFADSVKKSGRFLDEDDRLKALAEEYAMAEDEQVPDYEHEFSRKYKKRRKALIKSQKQRYRITFYRRGGILKTVIILILIIILMIMSAVAAGASKPSGGKLKLSLYQKNSAKVETVLPERFKNDSEIEPDKITQKYSPSLDESYKIISTFDEEFLYALTIEAENGEIFDFSQRLASIREYIEGENGKSESFNHGGIEYLWYSGKKNTLIWADFGYSFMLSSETLDRDELLSISTKVSKEE